LVELVVHVFCDLVVVGSNFAKNEINFFFCQNFIWHVDIKAKEP